MLKNIRLAAMAAALLIVAAAISMPPAIAGANAAARRPPRRRQPLRPAPAAPAAPAAKAPETIDNPYGLEALWKGGDLVAKTTLAILVLMSIGSWYIIVTKVYEQYKMGSQAKDAEQEVLEGAVGPPGRGDPEEEQPVPLHRRDRASKRPASTTACSATCRLNEWITMSIQRAIENVQSRTQDGLAFLATVGSTAPFVGLFGTVWGIYHALTAIGIAGQASIDKVAGPVGEALIMTAIGLAVAVPAVLGYNWLIRRNKAAMDQVRGFGADLHAVLLSHAQDRRGLRR